MSAYNSYTDFSTAQWNNLAPLIDLYYNGQLLTLSQVNTVLSGLVGEFKAVTTPTAATISSNTITIESVAKINLVKLDTNFLSIDELETIAWTGTRGMVVGDIYLFFMDSAGRRMRITDAGNFRPKNGQFTFQDLDSVIAFVVGRNSNLVEIGRYPSDDTADTSPTTSLEYVSSNTILASARVIEIIALTGETLAQGSITITSPSAHPGDAVAFIDEGGLGSVIIGQYTTSPGDTENDVATGLAASINLGTYSASAAVNVVTVTARPNTGSSANGFTLTASASGSVFISSVAAMGTVTLGVDGSETNANISTVTGGQDGPYWFKNKMTANTLTLISGVNFVGAGLPLAIPALEMVQVLKVGSQISIPV